MYAEFDIIRIWEVPAEELLAFPGLLPFVGLSRADNPMQMLRRAVQEIQNIQDETQQHEAMAAAYVLAGLKFETAVISQIIRRDVMRKSGTYQAILAEGREEGREKGREEGQKLEAIALTTRLLRRRLGQELSEELRSALLC